jgi:hypothetical protein
MKRPERESSSTHEEKEKKRQKVEAYERKCSCTWRESDLCPPSTSTLLLLVANEDFGYDMHWITGHPTSVDAVESALVKAHKTKEEDEITSFDFINLLMYVLEREMGMEEQKRFAKALTWGEDEEGEGCDPPEKTKEASNVTEEKFLKYFGSTDPSSLEYDVTSSEEGHGFSVDIAHCCKIMSCFGFH